MCLRTLLYYSSSWNKMIRVYKTDLINRINHTCPIWFYRIFNNMLQCIRVLVCIICMQMDKPRPTSPHSHTHAHIVSHQDTCVTLARVAFVCVELGVPLAGFSMCVCCLFWHQNAQHGPPLPFRWRKNIHLWPFRSASNPLAFDLLTKWIQQLLAQ